MCNWVMTVFLSAHTELTRTKTMSAKSVTSNVMVAALMLYVFIAQFISYEQTFSSGLVLSLALLGPFKLLFMQELCFGRHMCVGLSGWNLS